MTVREFANILYIKECLRNQDRAFKNLIKGSVQNSNRLSYSDDSYHGFVSGNNIQSFAKQVLDAGLSVKKTTQYIETLYQEKHSVAPKAKELYQNKTYKEALFDRVKDKFNGITPENMSGVLAQMFYDIIQDAAKESEKEPKPPKASGIAPAYTIADDEKRAILNLCEIINRLFESIKQKTEAIDRKQHELASISEDESKRRWKEYLEYELKALHKAVKGLYSELDKYCADLTGLLLNKQHLHPSFKAIYEIASQSDDEKYKITCPDAFRYSALSSLISNYQKSYEKLKACIQSL